MKKYVRPYPPDMLPDERPEILTPRQSLYGRMGPAPNTDELAAKPPKRRWWLKPAAAVMVVISMYVCWTMLVVPWWGGVQDHWNYGNARLTQFDANVGHSGLSHFIAEYQKGAIVVIELSYDDPNNSHVYTLPGMATGDEQPVILLSTVRDTSTGRLDLVVGVEGTNLQVTLYNTGKAFTRSGG